MQKQAFRPKIALIILKIPNGAYSMNKIIPLQTEFTKPREFVRGGPEYDALVHDLDFIADSIRFSGIENVVMQYFVDRASGGKSDKHLKHAKLVKTQKKALFILYAMVLRDYLGLTLRNFQMILASSPLFQAFCGINTWLGSEIPLFQEINALENSLDETIMRRINSMFVNNVILNNAKTKKLGLNEKFDLELLLTDSTCVKAKIHYPVDYVLFRDMIRTSMLKVAMIRKSGIKARMPYEAEEWLSKINALNIEMSMAYRQKDSKKKRKTIFRKMKKLFRQAMFHVEAHLKKFEKSWQDHDFSSIKAESIIITLQDMLDRQSDVISVANRRIINEEQVDCKDKILSIYEDDVNIITRNKDGSKVEFGNTLQFVEQADGFIVDYDLSKGPSKGDAEGCIESLKRILENYPSHSIKCIVADRGYDAKKLDDCIKAMNKKYNQKIQNEVLPKNPVQRKEKMKQAKFKKLQKRRSTTEAKVAHVKVITDNPMKQKGIRNRKTHMGIAVLSHNLMKLARLHREQEAEALKIS
jgi:hypothetical protein